MHFPESVTAQADFLSSLSPEMIEQFRVSGSLIMPSRLAADGDFGEEASALQLVGHIARLLPNDYAGGIGLESALGLAHTDAMTDPLWYAAYRLISTPKHPPLDPDGLKRQDMKLRDKAADRVRSELMGAGSFFARPSRDKAAEIAFSMGMGIGNESRPPRLHIGAEVAPERKFEEFLTALIEAVNALKSLKPLESNKVSVRWFCREFGHLTRELYQNAAQHGMQTATGKTIPRSFRAVLVRACDLDLQRLAGQDSFTAMLSPFERRTSRKVRAQQQGKVWDAAPTIPLLEISIVDNGPGLVRTWLAAKSLKESGVLVDPDLTTISASDERAILTECFKKHQTSKLRFTAGIGLFDVHRIMRKLGGLIVIRTSRIRVVRDYSKPSEEETPPEFENWDSRSPLLPEISGACVTLLLPLVPVGGAVEV